MEKVVLFLLNSSLASRILKGDGQKFDLQAFCCLGKFIKASKVPDDFFNQGCRLSLFCFIDDFCFLCGPIILAYNESHNNFLFLRRAYYLLRDECQSFN